MILSSCRDLIWQIRKNQQYRHLRSRPSSLRNSPESARDASTASRPKLAKTTPYLDSETIIRRLLQKEPLKRHKRKGLAPSVAPTTASNVKHLVKESRFHDEKLGQLLDAARLNLVGSEAKKALNKAAKARVVELKELRDLREVLSFLTRIVIQAEPYFNRMLGTRRRRTTKIEPRWTITISQLVNCQCSARRSASSQVKGYELCLSNRCLEY